MGLLRANFRYELPVTRLSSRGNRLGQIPSPSPAVLIALGQQHNDASLQRCDNNAHDAAFEKAMKMKGIIAPPGGTLCTGKRRVLWIDERKSNPIEDYKIPQIDAQKQQVGIQPCTEEAEVHAENRLQIPCEQYRQSYKDNDQWCPDQRSKPLLFIGFGCSHCLYVRRKIVQPDARLPSHSANDKGAEYDNENTEIECKCLDGEHDVTLFSLFEL